MPYWLFICIGVSLLVGVVWAIINKSGGYIFMAIPAFIITIFVSSIPFLAIDANDERYSLRYTEETTIYSLRTTELLSGNFCLGSGSIDNETYYIYYIQNSDLSYSIDRIKADDTKIFMDRQQGGVLTKVWAKINDTNLSDHWGYDEVIFSHYELHLPYGSLIQDYSVR